jgi:predicted transport protein
MSDLKLFRLGSGGVTEIPGSAVALEKSLQNLIEANLEAFLGVRFLATEFSTGKQHGGRMDTLGLDENGFPVIIEYKRSTNENVINQGLFYLDWLMDHKRDFEWQVMERYGAETAKAVDWSSPRLICIAGDFTKFDEHAVKQMDRNIELIRYRRYGDDLLLFELVNATTTGPAAAPSARPASEGGDARAARGTVSQYLEDASADLKDLFEALKAHLVALGDDVQVKTLKNYIAFKRIKNFACVEVHNRTKTLLVYVKVNPDSIELVEGFTRDVRQIGHFGTGDLEIVVRDHKDLERAIPLLERSYEAS